MSHNIKIREGALLIADAHFSHQRPELLSLIEAIHSKKLQATQLILMGDVFDALFGSVTHTLEINAQIVSLINDISEQIEVIYLEGNHDFNLKDVFPKAKVFTIQNQPIICTYEDKTVCLAHGDFSGDFFYKVYTSLIRNPSVLKLLNSFDNMMNHYILEKLDNYLSKKDDCKEFTGFEEYMKNRLANRVACDYFIEGHYHQNRSIDFENFRYINLGAFACNQRYFIVKSLQDKELLEENIFSKGI